MFQGMCVYIYIYFVFSPILECLQSFDFSQTIFLKSLNVNLNVNLLNGGLCSVLCSKNHSKLK